MAASEAVGRPGVNHCALGVQAGNSTGVPRGGVLAWAHPRPSGLRQTFDVTDHVLKSESYDSDSEETMLLELPVGQEVLIGPIGGQITYEIPPGATFERVFMVCNDTQLQALELAIMEWADNSFFRLEKIVAVPAGGSSAVLREQSAPASGTVRVMGIVPLNLRASGRIVTISVQTF